MTIKNTVLILSILMLAATTMSCGGGGAGEIVFYVAADGNDDWEGNLAKANPAKHEGPFLTIGRARQAVRELTASGGLTKPVTVYLRCGEYTMPELLTFTPDDSGTDEFPVTYTAFEDGAVLLTGGRSISGWSEQPGGVWTASVPGVQDGTWNFRQLFVNGKRRTRARIPNDGFLNVDGEISMEDKARFTFMADDIKESWAESGDVEIIALQAWAEIRMLITAVDPSSKMVTLSRKCRPSNREKNARYFVENTPDALDNPGEWYLDRESGILSYIPVEGEVMDSAEVIAPFITELVRFEGDPEYGRFVENITLRGLTFSYTDWSLAEDGYADTQAANEIPGVIVGNGAKSITIVDCSITHHGNYGIEFTRGCSNIDIVGNEIADMGAGGIRIGEKRNREKAADKTFGVSVSDNHIHDIGEVYPAACGIIIFRSGKNHIAHNHIHNTYYTGISNGWSWGYAETDTKKNIIEYNHVHDIGRGMLSDMGGNYNLGVQPGTVIRNNLFHDITSYGYGGWGIYTDEGSSYILIENNVVHDTKTGGFHQHYGRENIVRNNIFANAKLGQIIRTRMEDHLSFTFERNIVYWSEGPLLGSNWSDDKYKLDYNLYYHTSGAPVVFKDWTLDEWREKGQDVHSIVADPLFADPAHGDFSLKQESPAFELGFKQIDVSGVGPRR